MGGIVQDLAGVMHLIDAYPLYRGPVDKGRAVGRFLAWQVLGRLRRDGMDMRFVNDTRLRVKRRLGGRLHYVLGLAEVDDMAFVAHLLRRDELFVDVGANIGAYSVLAAVAAGARCLAFEPAELAYRYLLLNVALNGLEPRVEVQRMAVGAAPGKLRLTAGMGEVNHVLREGEDAASFQIDMTSLDAFCAGREPPVAIKIDVEGFETEVLHGAKGLLRKRVPLAVLAELVGWGERYGYDEAALRGEMEGYGYTACSYDALTRTLKPLTGPVGLSNTLFVRDLAEARARIESAEAFTVGRYRI